MISSLLKVFPRLRGQFSHISVSCYQSHSMWMAEKRTKSFYVDGREENKVILCGWQRIEQSHSMWMAEDRIKSFYVDGKG